MKEMSALTRRKVVTKFKGELDNSEKLLKNNK